MRYNTITVILLSIVLQFFALSDLLAQDYMRIKLKNGTTTTIALKDIKTLSFEGLATALPEQQAKVASAMLRVQAFPNPAKEEVHITYELLERGAVKLEIFSLQGQLVYSFDAGIQEIGSYTHQWNALQPGAYLCKVSQNNMLVTQKLLVR